jgi:hypothetical protein
MHRCLVVEFLSLPRVALPCPQFALLHSVTFVQLRLITIFGNCGCVAVASFIGVPPALMVHSTLVMSSSQGVGLVYLISIIEDNLVRSSSDED